MVRIRRREEVVGNVRPDPITDVVPIRRRRYAPNLADEPLLGQLPSGVGVALDVVVTALPVPVSVPPHARVGGLVDVGALGAGAEVRAPRIVVEGVACLGVVGELFAECLGEAGGSQSEHGKELHLGCLDQRWLR